MKKQISLRSAVALVGLCSLAFFCIGNFLGEPKVDIQQLSRDITKRVADSLTVQNEEDKIYCEKVWKERNQLIIEKVQLSLDCIKLRNDSKKNEIELHHEWIALGQSYLTLRNEVQKIIREENVCRTNPETCDRLDKVINRLAKSS